MVWVGHACPTARAESTARAQGVKALAEPDPQGCLDARARVVAWKERGKAKLRGGGVSPGLLSTERGLGQPPHHPLKSRQMRPGFFQMGKPLHTRQRAAPVRRAR